MISQDGNTRDQSKMRRPELKSRLQDAWKRIDALEAENKRLRWALRAIRDHSEPDGVNGDTMSVLLSMKSIARHAFEGGGGGDE